MSAKIIETLFNTKTAENVNADLPKQTTLKNPIHCSGQGVHSGNKVSMRLLPAPAGTGIIFKRTDIAGHQTEIRASWENVVETKLCTVIGHENGVRIATVEHLMAALYGAQIDNVIVELDSAEVPIMDGSSAPFLFLIECAGTVEQDAERIAIEILKPVTVERGNAHATLSPASDFSVSYKLDYENSPIAQQVLAVTIRQDIFRIDIARARSFGFLSDWDKLKQGGYALGASLDNAVVISGDSVMNEGGLRYDDEFVRHKILDCVGDLYLAGAQIIGHFHGVRSGHALNCLMLKELFKDKTAWRYRNANPPRQAAAPMWDHQAADLAVGHQSSL